MPVRRDAFQKQRRPLALHFAFDREIQHRRLTRFPMSQDRLRLAWVMIAVVEKENDLATHLRLQPSRGLEFREQKPSRKKPARLLAKADNRT
jgi:hypothetical protein